MAEFSEKYSKIIKYIEKSISDEKEREIVLKKVSELSFMYMDVIDRISNVNSERIDDIEKHQDKLDKKIGKVKDTVDLIKKDIYEDEDYDFEIVCPYCNHEFVADIEDELKEEIECPECHNKIELDWDAVDADIMTNVVVMKTKKIAILITKKKTIMMMTCNLNKNL